MKRTVTLDGSSAPPARRARVAGKQRSKAGKGQIYKSVGTPNGVHYFRKVATTNVRITDQGFAIGVSRTQFFSMQFNLTQFFFYINNTGSYQTANVPGYTEIQALFDQVMVQNVVVKMTFLTDAANAPGSAVGAQVPQMYHCIDYNDASVPASMADVNQYGNVKSKILTASAGPIIRKIEPRFPSVVYASALGSTYQAKRGFLTGNVDAAHYGMKGAISILSVGDGTTTVGYLVVDVAYTYACKNQI